MIPQGFNRLIHAQHRLQICSILAAVDTAEFAVVRDELGVSDSVLSKNLSALEEVGYVTLRKQTVNTRPRTWISLTRTGKSAYKHHVEALQQLVATSKDP